MVINFYQKKTLFFILYMIYICNCNKDYKIISSKIYTLANFDNRIMYIETNDIKCRNRLDLASFYSENPPPCHFGLGYNDKIPDNYNGERNDSIKYLIASKKIKKHIFSIGKWEFPDEHNITFKLYLGDTHENFSGENVGTCQIQNNTGHYGCIFHNFTFLGKTYSLKKEGSNEYYTIYFSTEEGYVYFPKSFEKKFENEAGCVFPDSKTPATEPDFFFCKKLFGSFLPLTLSNDNMNMTLEIDCIFRYYLLKGTYNIDEIRHIQKINHQYRILIHDKDYIIFPMIMFKKFHVQFDIGNNLISFYSNNENITRN